MEVAATIYSNLFGTAGQLDPATITSQILQSYDKVFSHDVVCGCTALECLSPVSRPACFYSCSHA
jgi:hypothetical protein